LDQEYNNFLHIAAEAGHLDVIGFLIEQGVNIHHKNKHDKLPREMTGRKSI
jgi:ankyrin repeat protein